MPRALRSVASSSTMPERPPSAALPRATSPGSSPPSRISRPPSVRRFVINDAGAATVRGAAASDVTWQFTAIPDKPPTIALAKEPEGQARGALQLSYKLEDDYGVIGAQALFKLLSTEGTNGHPARPPYSAPDFPLVRPQAP